MQVAPENLSALPDSTDQPIGIGNENLFTICDTIAFDLDLFDAFGIALSVFKIDEHFLKKFAPHLHRARHLGEVGEAGF